MNYIIFDLEATCTSDRSQKFQNEIIEIGAVKINDKLEIIDEYQSFIKPILNPKLTDFCKELTSIKQSDVDSADKFPIVISEFMDWVGDDSILCSWGFYDKKQIISDLQLHKTKWFFDHISLKHQHADFKRLRKGVGVQKALSMEQMTFEGVHHRGIDDAKNIAKIFIKNFDKWDFDKK